MSRLKTCMLLANALALALALTLTLTLGGCASMRQTAAEITVRAPGHRLLGTPQPARPEAVRDVEFAWLSEAAYGNTTAGLEKKDEIAPVLPRLQIAGNASGDGVECPVPQAALMARGWQPWPGFPGSELVQAIKRYHLRIEVWTRVDPPAVAVAFGGTVLGNKNDWSANLRWFLPKAFLAGHPDEYSATVQLFAPAFAAEFRNKLASGSPEWAFLKNAALYSTGHSLGGGLAQQFAYSLPLDAPRRVAQVYAFDPSPVTGFYSVEPALRDVNRKTLAIDRIYERGEVLALARSFTSFFVAPSASDPAIRGVRYSLFYPALPIAGHSIHHFACRLHG